jgi:hypothetical protein
MLFKRSRSLLDFYDVTVVICYPESDKEQEAFGQVFAGNSRYFQRNGVEVVLVARNGIGKSSLSDLLDAHPLINWKIVNCAAEERLSLHARILAGIRHADHAFILIMEACAMLVTDVVHQLRYILYHYPGHYALGRAALADELPFGIGCMMIGSAVLNSIEECRGQENGFAGWCSKIGGILEPAGLGRLQVPEAVTELFRLSSGEGVSLPQADQNKEQKHGGGEKLIYDWRKNKRGTARNLVLAQFDKYWLAPQDPFEKEYGIICLIQARNEINNIPQALLHMDDYCDGIILLDDGSEDGTFDEAASEKLLLKVQKKYIGVFDDLANRNLLLQLGHLFKAKWFIFMDADERFDARYADLQAVAKLENIDTVGFRIVHIWDEEEHYRRDLPEGRNGVISRYRMFRNKGFLQINTQRELHFRTTPFKRNKYHAAILVLHYGLMDKNVRKRKYDLYSKQDKDGKKQGFAYDYLLDENVSLENVHRIKI